jgi:hypothetical protein
VPFTHPVTIVPAVAPETVFQSDHPLFARISAIRWYDQYYWPFALDQSAEAQVGGHYDRLLVDRNRDGDMADEGELVLGRPNPDGTLLTFEVGELLFVDKRREDSRFPVTELVVTVEVDPNPIVQFSTTMHHRMYSDLEYSLRGPYGKELRFSTDPTQMPTVNLTPEIVAAPDFDGKEIQLTLENGDAPFMIGKERQLELVCLTGDPEKNDFVLAIGNAAFEKPVLVTLIYTDGGGETRRRDFELHEWVGDYGFAGTISVPEEAQPGPATLLVNFSETEMARDRQIPTHFTQVVPRGTPFVTEAGEEIAPRGWEVEIELVQ